MLLIRSEQSIPRWTSSVDSLRLCVGESKFMCCEKNHKAGFESCDRDVAGEIMIKMIETKTNFLFSTGNFTIARLLLVRRKFMLRGLKSSDAVKSLGNTPEAFQKNLRMSNDNFFDENGVSILMYAVIASLSSIVSQIVNTKIKKESNKEERDRMIHSSWVYELL